MYAMPLRTNMVVSPTAIDSPPELSLSKSSKSSDDRSFPSCLSDALSIENLSHFEDISLDDVNALLPFDSEPQPLKRSSTTPLPPTINNRHRRSGYAVDSMHSVHVARTNSGGLPVLPGSNPPRSPRALHRLSTSSNHITTASRSRDTRSSSPRKSFQSSGGASPRSIGSFSFLGPSKQSFGRRQSWQPGRKTVRELEAECHYSDEEVPEDAVMHNVPISPLPVPSAQHTRSNSRVRTSDDEIPTSYAQSRQSASAPPSRPYSKHADSPSPSSPSHPGLPRSATIDIIPPSAGLPNGIPATLLERTQSWASCLSDDARQISSALDAHLAQKTSPSSSDGSLSDIRRTIVDYPPLQRNNIMIDPLPISKEKEAVLARTRPSWLPPKDKREEKRHLKQWEKMMQKSAAAERRREDKQSLDHDRTILEKARVAQVWDEHVLPNWDLAIDEPRTRELWWRGLAPKTRPMVWPRAIGNDLGLSSATYLAATERATKIEQKIEDMTESEREQSKEAQWFVAIDRDCVDVYPETSMFASGSLQYTKLVQVLKSYACYRSDVGYVHGLHTIAALLVLNTPTPEIAFTAFANVLQRSLPLAYLIRDAPTIERWQRLMVKTLKYKLPMLHDHLLSGKVNSASPQAWTEPLLSTLLTHNMRADAAARIWDVYVFEGDKLLVRAFAGVLSRLESRLYGSEEDVLQLLGWAAPSTSFQSGIGSDIDAILKSIRNAGKMDSETA